MFLRPGWRAARVIARSGSAYAYELQTDGHRAQVPYVYGRIRMHGHPLDAPVRVLGCRTCVCRRTGGTKRTGMSSIDARSSHSQVHGCS